MKATLHTDGGSRGNPGPAAIGYVLAIDDAPIITHGETIGSTTNNQAEYRALLAGMKRAHAERVTELACFLDSELVVRQVLGEYRIKDQGLKPLAAEVVSLRHHFSKLSFVHIRREHNASADALVNEALDKKLN